MKSRLKISIFGILMILILIFGDNYKYTVVALCAALAHESGHIIAALILKMKLDGFTLNILGARIGISLPMYSYKKELLLSLSGPIANITSGIISLCIYKSSVTQTNTYLLFFTIASFFLAILNLLPIKGFDGGRIFVCFLAPLSGAYTPEIWLGRLSFLFIFLLWVISVYLMLRIGSSLTLFVFSTALFAELFLSSEGFKK